MLQFEQIEKYYGNHLALQISKLQLEKGLFWLKGENGSGKTTMMKMVAGLHPFKGDILLDGISIKNSRNEFLKLVNFAEAEPIYPSFLTAKDLVELYCSTKKANIKESIQMLKDLHIFDAYHNSVGSYSSGMLKKLSIALALIGNPQWILLDEPLITIDVAAVALVCDWINKMHVEIGISFIISSHQSFQNILPFTAVIEVQNHTVTIQDK
jgi:ABC-2 type transport system ATP-binding protein